MVFPLPRPLQTSLIYLGPVSDKKQLHNLELARHRPPLNQTWIKDLFANLE